MPDKPNDPGKSPAGVQYAIVDLAGKQFRVEAGQELQVPSRTGEPGGNIQLDRILLLHDGNTTHFGAPTIAGASVDATILSHGRERKITIFKFRRRKGYQKKQGHRQTYTLLRVNSISLSAEKSEKASPPTATKGTGPSEAGRLTVKAPSEKPVKTGAKAGKSPAARKTTAKKSRTSQPRDH